MSLSIFQIIFDAYQSNNNLDNKAQQILKMVKAPTTQAAYRIDAKMGLEILNGLQAMQEVHLASIKLTEGPELVSIERPLYQSIYRHFSDYIFYPVREYHLPLTMEESSQESYGTLPPGY